MGGVPHLPLFPPAVAVEMAFWVPSLGYTGPFCRVQQSNPSKNNMGITMMLINILYVPWMFMIQHVEVDQEGDGEETLAMPLKPMAERLIQTLESFYTSVCIFMSCSL